MTRNIKGSSKTMIVTVNDKFILESVEAGLITLKVIPHRENGKLDDVSLKWTGREDFWTVDEFFEIADTILAAKKHLKAELSKELADA